jgi:drug/metabolite transporter (DMT)-like permease
MTGNLRGIIWMATTGILFVAVTGIVRHLGTDMSPVQAAFIRYLFGLLLLLPVFLRMGSLRRPASVVGLHASRGVIHGVGVMLWFFAMANIPIAEVTALGFTAPIFTTVGAALFLGERLRLYRIGAVLMGFGGALVVLQPGFQEINIGSIAQLTAAPLFAASFLIAKRLTKVESSTAIVAYLSVFVTLVLLAPAIYVWRTPTVIELIWLFANRGSGHARPLHLDPGLPGGGHHRDPAHPVSATSLGHHSGAGRVRRTARNLDLGRWRHDCRKRNLQSPIGKESAARTGTRRSSGRRQPHVNSQYGSATARTHVWWSRVTHLCGDSVELRF